MKFIILTFCIWLVYNKEKQILTQFNTVTKNLIAWSLEIIKSSIKNGISFSKHLKNIIVNEIPLWTLTTFGSYLFLFAINFPDHDPVNLKDLLDAIPCIVFVINSVSYIAVVLFATLCKFGAKE